MRQPACSWLTDGNDSTQAKLANCMQVTRGVQPHQYTGGSISKHPTDDTGSTCSRLSGMRSIGRCCDNRTHAIRVVSGWGCAPHGT